MDAKTNFKARLPRRRLTEVRERAPHGDRGIACSAFDVAEIFKKTLYRADSRLGGRYVAKELFEVDGIPLLTTTLHGSLHGDGGAVTGRTTAENPKSVQSNPNKAEKVSYADA
jgi:hypothetical protein